MVAAYGRRRIPSDTVDIPSMDEGSFGLEIRGSKQDDTIDGLVIRASPCFGGRSCKIR